MALTAKQGFAKRLVEAMLDKGIVSARGSKSGVDPTPLSQIAKVTREMARRYTEGLALPDADRMKRIAEWLSVRPAWLRDGEGAKRIHERGDHQVEEPGGTYLTEEQTEILRIYGNLPAERREWFRNLMSLEAIVAQHYPWLAFGGRPKKESYDEYERRVERDLLRLADRLQRTK